MIICGTRVGITKFRERANLLPQHYLIAPIDMDPGSVQWPVKGSLGICLIVAGATDEYVLRLTQALLADGAELVVQLRDPNPASFHRRLPPGESSAVS
jgi:hypothetical protein